MTSSLIVATNGVHPVEPEDIQSELYEELEEIGLGRIFSRLDAAGAKNLEDVEKMTPTELQKLIPAVGTRRKLLNNLNPGCPASGPASIPFRADHFSPPRVTRSSSAKKRKPVAPTKTHAKEIFKVSHSYRRTPSYTIASEYGTPMARSGYSRREHSIPRKGKTSARTRSKTVPENVGETEDNSLPPPPPSSGAGTPVLTSQILARINPVFSEATKTPPTRTRPTFMSRKIEDIFTLLTSDAVGLPPDRAATYEKVLENNAVVDRRTLMLLSDSDLEKLGIPLGHRRRIQAALHS
eukprot:TRINITY_DN7454_c0_g1_i1.p1 TRINITY_DN7454_c0_g1~~TRINITY_DN7454_c0_g1_i1.p1  ORF type:complete len:295 (+),score=57.32 TRINITY_DN7454_c0_g1_i1:42-926(+)